MFSACEDGLFSNFWIFENNRYSRNVSVFCATQKRQFYSRSQSLFGKYHSNTLACGYLTPKDIRAVKKKKVLARFPPTRE